MEPRQAPTRAVPSAAQLAQPLKQAIAARVVALFNDKTKGERPVTRRAEGLFGPGSVAWRVHGDVASMMVGGIASLLLQMLHPSVLAGVWDHSNFRRDMHGRLRRTARFVSLTTYGDRAEALSAIERVTRIHDRVRGHLPDGTPYVATDPRLLAWVHVTEATCFLDSWIRYVEPGMGRAVQDRYFAEMAQVATLLGADPVPRSRAEAEALLQAFRPELRADHRSAEVAGLVLRSPAVTGPVGRSVQALGSQAAIDLLPDWARRMHRLPNPVLARPLVRAGTLGLAGTIRWAMRPG